MTSDSEHFEQELREDMACLAREAGQGLRQGQVTAKLRRRSRGRRAIVSAAIVIVGLGTLAIIAMRQEPRREVDQTSLVRSRAGGLPNALPVDATQTQVLDALRQYLASIGDVQMAEIEKDFDGRVSFALAGTLDKPTQAVQSGFEAVLQNFDRAHVRASARDVTFQLIAWGSQDRRLHPRETGGRKP